MVAGGPAARFAPRILDEAAGPAVASRLSLSGVETPGGVAFMKLLLTGAALSLALMASAPARAADSPPGATTPVLAGETVPTPRALELSRRYMKAMHFPETMKTMMNNMAPAMIDQELKAHPEDAEEITPEIRQALSEVTTDILLEKLPIMEEKMVLITAQTFTEQELADLVAFYEGPTGQAVMRKMPMMMRHLPELMESIGAPDAADIKARLCRKIDCSVKKLPGALKS
jgi:hypothetical protein